MVITLTVTHCSYIFPLYTFTFFYILDDVFVQKKPRSALISILSLIRSLLLDFIGFEVAFARFEYAQMHSL